MLVWSPEIFWTFYEYIAVQSWNCRDIGELVKKLVGSGTILIQSTSLQVAEYKLIDQTTRWYRRTGQETQWVGDYFNIQFLAVYRLADFNYRRAQSWFVVNVSVQTANPDTCTYTNLELFVYAWGSFFCGYTSDDELEVIIHAHAVDR